MARGLRWSEAQLAAHLAGGGRVVGRPETRRSVPLADGRCEGPGQYVVFLDHFKTQTEKNANEHWWTRSRRAREQRSTVYRWLQHCLGLQCPVGAPWTVTVTRVAPGTLDGFDNLQSALSHCVDGVSDYLAGAYRTGQDARPDLTWGHGQRQGAPGQYGVEIRLAGTPRP
jgi:hypothetical protein